MTLVGFIEGEKTCDLSELKSYLSMPIHYLEVFSNLKIILLELAILSQILMVMTYKFFN